MKYVLCLCALILAGCNTSKECEELYVPSLHDECVVTKTTNTDVVFPSISTYNVEDATLKAKLASIKTRYEARPAARRSDMPAEMMMAIHNHQKSQAQSSP